MLKNIILWDMTPCSSFGVNRRFGGTYRLHLQACHLLLCWFLAELIYSTPKMEAICSSETSVDTQRTTRIFQKMILFITTAVKTSNPTTSYADH
jgi:hypothetical protein